MRLVASLVGGVLLVGAAGGAGAQNAAPAQAQQPMSFFVTSAGKGDGGNLGGLEGADAWCAQLAARSGAPLRRVGRVART